MNLDLNCDLGEGEPAAQTAALMKRISSANIACGGHAGNADTMRRAVELALQCGANIGAHPGLPGREHFGRALSNADTPDLKRILDEQVGALLKITAEFGAPLHHIKLHGALYHYSEEAAATYLAHVQASWPGLVVYARAGSSIVHQSAPYNVQVWPEGFLDRGYLSSGRLIPRGSPGDVLPLDRVRDRLHLLASRGVLLSADGAELRLPVRTWCVHSDSPDALKILDLSQELKFAKF